MKLDLHTHCLEATRFSRPTVGVVGEIVARIKAKGLDGIGITEHENKEYGFGVRDIVEQHFGNEVLIIPGRERLLRGGEEMVELYLPNNSVFRFWVHPRSINSSFPELDKIQGIEIENPLHNWHINKEKVREIAKKYNLLLLSNSDAHYLDDIGKCYNEIELEELYARASSQ